ncbi:hypothetical protein [Cognatazoarcus halotolerans]|uniref:hypothetical protein n=1 Tax=Cognatazoarcus halotolerans TaxID=2686016 RepID=UPI00135BF9CE|nr:hypothetical protein [Cognatazoarcus halotolerans]MBX3678736.1 hypothetical protein [Rhodocyclaceae bacterium]MCB1898438.1 hypothetical protein [Rhodocyclaceae bacterium]MCP5309383.1 hypothetical protein [Zoogloeaceae bacterium]
MKTHRHDKPQSITANDLETLARQGLDRALAARQKMNELSAAELDRVSGGAVLSKLSYPIIAGGIFGPIDILNNPLDSQMAVPVLR